jgi:peroxiredoxin
MNLLKSIYVVLYMVVATAISVSAVQRLIETRDIAGWGGVLMVYVPFLLVLSWIMLFRNIPRTSARFPVLIGLGVAGVAASALGYVQGGSGLALVLAATGLVGFLLYDYWYSGFAARHSSLLEAGNMLPEFELRNTTGEIVSSTEFADRPTVWIFYRGNWCPLCMAQVKEIAAQYRELDALGVRVALVSPQPHKFTRGLAKKFDVPFDFLTDDNNQAARQLGIAHSFGVPMGMQVLGYDSETVMPTVIIAEVGGRILWADETDNYRVRPDPDVFLEILRAQ